MSECDHEASTMRRPGPLGALLPWRKIEAISEFGSLVRHVRKIVKNNHELHHVCLSIRLFIYSCGTIQLSLDRFS
jgi:hypothetical protein